MFYDTHKFEKSIKEKLNKQSRQVASLKKRFTFWKMSEGMWQSRKGYVKTKSYEAGAKQRHLCNKGTGACKMAFFLHGVYNLIWARRGFSFLKQFIHLLIYFWLCFGFRREVGFSLVVASEGSSLVAVRSWLLSSLLISLYLLNSTLILLLFQPWFYNHSIERVKLNMKTYLISWE